MWSGTFLKIVARCTAMRYLLLFVLIFSACTVTQPLTTSHENVTNQTAVAPIVTPPREQTATEPSAPARTDLTKLPLGGKLSTSPQFGAIYNCRSESTGGGAEHDGPWIHGDTYDLTAKEIVHGSVSWPKSFTISVQGDTRMVSGNALPEHTTGVYPISSTDPAYQYDRNPNKIAAQTFTLRFPLTPVLTTPSCVGGEVGISLSGSPIFNGLDADLRDAVAYEVQDTCGGHPERTGTYHYHSISSCVDIGNHMHVGYALDGFGIYGHRHENGDDVTNDDLDECHGHTHTILWNDKNVSLYHYHATWEYPYTVGCFRGARAAMQVVTTAQTQNPPDLAAAALKLGISEETLKRALGPPPPNLATAAAKLGISEQQLRGALAP
jgi:hypothetical protein